MAKLREDTIDSLSQAALSGTDVSHRVLELLQVLGQGVERVRRVLQSLDFELGSRLGGITVSAEALTHDARFFSHVFLSSTESLRSSTPVPFLSSP